MTANQIKAPILLALILWWPGPEERQLWQMQPKITLTTFVFSCLVFWSGEDSYLLDLRVWLLTSCVRGSRVTLESELHQCIFVLLTVQ